MVASTHERNSAGYTYDEWMAHWELPEGFLQWHGSWVHWRAGDSIGWAIVCYKDTRAWHRLQWEESRRQRNASKKNRPAPVA